MVRRLAAGAKSGGVARSAGGCPEIHIGQGIFERARMDWAIGQLTELGVCSVAPLLCTRGIRRATQHTSVRWQWSAAEVAQRCGRACPPTVFPPVALRQWLRRLPAAAVRLLFAPSGGTGLAALSPWPRRPIYALIGPRPGLTEEEERAAVAAGFRAVTLGPRLLRVETAAVAAVASLQAVAGDFARDFT
ncbi:MAG: RsmE family RNA methyltransferase [Gammaproteobacteria bacterium]|nr:RsmE family RNA methyltransferase [Gammaproteobacteria bacterium]